MNGRDQSDTALQGPGRALMQYGNNFAWMQGKKWVVLQPQKPLQLYLYDVASKRLRDAPLDPAPAKTAHAQRLWGLLAYDKHWYRSPWHGSIVGVSPGCRPDRADSCLVIDMSASGR